MVSLWLFLLYSNDIVGATLGVLVNASEERNCEDLSPEIT